MASEDLPLTTLLARAACLRCPNCGEGKLFKAYLKPVESCSACNEPYGHIRADDGPAWFTMVIVGFIIVPILVLVEMKTGLSLAVKIPLLCVLTTLLVLAILPITKALMIAIIWRIKFLGSS